MFSPNAMKHAEFLSRYAGILGVRLNQYDPARFNLLVNQTKASLMDGFAELQLGGSKWLASIESVAVTSDELECTVTFNCVSGILMDASVAVDLEIENWSVDHYVLMPAAVYRGNRFPSRRIPYSPKLWFKEDIGPDKPVIVTDIPKLTDGAGPSRIQERSGSMALPSLGFHDSGTGRGLWLVTDQGNELGDYGIGIEENRKRDKASISITSPIVRESYHYRICDMHHPSEDVPGNFKEGNVVRIAFRIHGFSGSALQCLFDKYAEIRKPAPTARMERIPFSACFALQEQKFNRDNFVPDHGYYSVGLRQNFLQDWQIGWTGGMISTYPLLFAGSQQTRENVLRNFDWLFPYGISPSGLFWDCCANGTEWIGGDIRKPHTGNWHLIRKSADAVHFILKQFSLMEMLGIDVKPAWRKGTRQVCDSLVRLWKNHGQFGQFVDSISGEIRVGGSTSAAIAPAALVQAANWFGNDAYLEVALQSARHFYQDFTAKGLSYGGPGDALQNPDSESWFALIESYMALHDATGDRDWLERAAQTSRQFSTWVVSYDFRFPPESLFGRSGILSTGSVYANTQNKHAAPGLCTFSGLGLLKLFRATGDRFHLDLLQDIAHGLPQYLPHPLKPLGDATPGHMCERVNMTDWEGLERIGETLGMSTWAETSLMLTSIEIPGIYARPDLGIVVAFDHITAEIIEDTHKHLEVRLGNPTSLPASIRILCEQGEKARIPLSENHLYGCRLIQLMPGASEIVRFSKSEL